LEEKSVAQNTITKKQNGIAFSREVEKEYLVILIDPGKTKVPNISFGTLVVYHSLFLVLTSLG
jgi:hypothetical protein